MNATLLGVAIAATLAGILAFVAVWNLRRQRKCPSCRVELVSLNPQKTGDGAGPLGYEVLVCPRCTNALTLVAGSRSRYAFCPECRQRTLETPCIRIPDGQDGQPRVEVHENCQLCGHQAVREVGDTGPQKEKKGQVLQFPGKKKEAEK